MRDGEGLVLFDHAPCGRREWAGAQKQARPRRFLGDETYRTPGASRELTR